MPTETLVNATDQQLDSIARRAAQLLAAGRLIVIPTETVYGIAASVANPAGLAALRAFKERPDTQPFTVHMPGPASAERYIDTSIPLVRRLIRKVFPGPMTLVVDVSEDVIHDRLRALGLPPEARDRLYHQNTIGLRCPDHPVAQHVLGALSDPIVASSANRRGQAPPMDAHQAARDVADAADLIIDGGPCRYAKPSTIVRVRQADGMPKVTVERAGVYDERFVRKLLRWTMLLVCSGNTCRSPMAEAIAKQMLATERKIPLEELETAGIRVISAGAFASPGMPATPEAVEAMHKMGLELSHHRSRTLTPELIHEADVIYCMTDLHRQAVVDMVPSAADKTLLLDANGEIEDPIGFGATAYQRCAELIRRRLDQRLKEQQP